jgi:hypothetical protein
MSAELRTITPEMRRDLAQGAILVRDTLPDNWSDAEMTLDQERSPFLLWSGLGHPPRIGEKVTLRGFGAGVVLAYYTQRSYLGVLVDPIDAPDSWRARNAPGTLVTAFGAEITRSTQKLAA